MRLKFKEYLLYSVIIIIINVFMYMFFKSVMNLDGSSNIHKTNEYGWPYAINIIMNNTQHYIQYLVLFLFSPFFILVDSFLITLQLYISIETRGIANTVTLMWKHSLIEIPNMLLFMSLSIKALTTVYKEKDWKSLFIYFKENSSLYLLSLILVIVAGLIEGLMG
ncbi:stage II sporulation protein M [Staphylococcus simulans]|uniref:stage II sporulation protein M n=1 Tax=Staphylococcus simulans TaxID=1286 RepID=UPI001E327F3C|nr:stage II sporulation protein M [Staphylococcus simulans]MCD8915292.1 stage II sporulation protein M [Staphylococcus simulans]